MHDRPRKVYLLTTTQGCEINLYHTTQVRDFLVTNGHEIVDDPAEATDIVVMTCSVLTACQEQSERILEQFSDGHAAKRLFALGCLPAFDRSLPILQPYEVLDPKEFDQLSKFFSGPTPYRAIRTHKIDSALVGIEDRFSNRFTILVAQGCLGSCSYCAIKKAKGGVTSRDEKDILSRFDEILATHRRPVIALLCEDLGSYGADTGTDAVALLEKLTDREGDYELEIQNFEPSRFLLLAPRLETVFRRGKIVKIHIAVQSGSQRVLAAMKRQYDVATLIAYLKGLIERYPDLIVETSFIVNFPTESHEDFHATSRLLPLFDEVMVFNYSRRQGTPAADLPDSVPEAEREVRLGYLRELAKVHPGLSIM